MEKERSSQSTKVSEMRLKFEDGGVKTSSPGHRLDNNQGNDVSELAGLAAVARRRDKPQIKGGILVNSSPFNKTQLGRRRSSDSAEGRVTPQDVLIRELKSTNSPLLNRHAVARRTVSEFVVRDQQPVNVISENEILEDEGDKPATPVPVPRRRNPKKHSISPNNVITKVNHLQNKDISPVLPTRHINNGSTDESHSGRSWLHENNSAVTATSTCDKIKRPLPELPPSALTTSGTSSSSTTPLRDNTSPNTNARRRPPCDFKPKVPCGGTGSSLVQQIVQGINSGANAKPPCSKGVNGAKMESTINNVSSSQVCLGTPSAATDSDEIADNAGTNTNFKSPNVQDAIRNLDSAAANVEKPLPQGPPPHKPPRTFEHDLYLAQKALLRPTVIPTHLTDSRTTEKRKVAFGSPVNHVYDEVLDANGEETCAVEAGGFYRRRSLTTPTERGRGNSHALGRKHHDQKSPPPPPPIFKRSNSNNDNAEGKTQQDHVAKTPAIPYAVSRLQHRLIARFSHSKTGSSRDSPEVPARKSKFFVELNKKSSPERVGLPLTRSLSNEHIYDEPYTEPQPFARHLIRSLSDEAISNPEYDGLSCHSGIGWPRPGVPPERGQVCFDNGSEHSGKEPGLHYMSTPILRKGRSYSYDAACMVAPKPSETKPHSKGWIKANCEMPKTTAPRPVNPAARHKFQ